MFIESVRARATCNTIISSSHLPSSRRSCTNPLPTLVFLHLCPPFFPFSLVFVFFVYSSLLRMLALRSSSSSAFSVFCFHLLYLDFLPLASSFVSSTLLESFLLFHQIFSVPSIVTVFERLQPPPPPHPCSSPHRAFIPRLHDVHSILSHLPRPASIERRRSLLPSASFIPRLKGREIGPVVESITSATFISR